MKTMFFQRRSVYAWSFKCLKYPSTRQVIPWLLFKTILYITSWKFMQNKEIEKEIAQQSHVEHQDHHNTSSCHFDTYMRLVFSIRLCKGEIGQPELVVYKVNMSHFYNKYVYYMLKLITEVQNIWIEWFMIDQQMTLYILLSGSFSNNLYIQFSAAYQTGGDGLIEEIPRQAKASIVLPPWMLQHMNH